MLILLAASKGVCAEAEVTSAFPPIKVSGSLSTSLSSSDRLLNDKSGVAFSRGALKVTQTLKPGLIWRMDADVSSRQAHGGDSAAVLREAYLSYRDGPLDVKVGLQNILWGRADVINPTDNLTPRRYTWLSMADTNQRVGTPALQAGYQFDFGKVSVVALPVFRPSIVPFGDAGGLSIRDVQPDSPEGDFALKLEQQESGPEWSVSWLHGHSLRPNLVPSAKIASNSTLELRYPKVDVIGADFAVPWRSLIFRGESAYTRADNCCNIAGAEFRKRNNLLTVIGAESAILDSWRMVTQIFHKQNFEKERKNPGTPPMLLEIARASNIANEELRAAYTGIALGIYPSTLGANLKGGLDAAWVVQTRDYVIRPRLSYYLQDNLSLNIAADFYGGSREGPLGQLRDNTLIMTSIQWDFNRTIN